MLVTPNQLSISRVVLVPVPIVLFFYGGLVGKAVALMIFLLLGLTDFLDGYLARKYGSTEFGKFLDPISDKIFMAAIYLPLLHLEVIPLWPVAIMFIREFLITELRTIYNFRDAQFTTSAAGKMKMNLQGFGAAAIVLVAFFGPIVPKVVTGVTALGILSASLVWKLKRGRTHVWFRYGIVISMFIFALIAALPANASIYLLVLTAMLISVYSGGEYLIGGWRELVAHLSESPTVRSAYIIASCLVVPMGLLILVKVGSLLLFWPVLLTLALAFTSGGLDNYLSLKRVPYSYGYKWLKLAFQLVFLGWAIYLYSQGAVGDWRFPVAVFAVASGELIYGLGYVIKHFPAFKEGSRFLTAEEAAKGSVLLGEQPHKSSQPQPPSDSPSPTSGES